MKQVGFAIIGCGMVANIHADAIKEITGAYLKGVWDVRPEAVQSFTDKYSVYGYQSFEELLEDQSVQVVCVCTPPGFHAEHGMKLAEAGKHLVVEKPIDVEVASAEKLVKIYREKGLKLAVVFQNRFTPAAMKVKEAVDKGLLGELILGDAYVKWYRSPEYYAASSWRGTWKIEGGAALINQAIHTIDLIQWLMGGVSSVSGIIKTTTHSIEGEDLGVAIVEYKNGALGVIEGSTAIVPGFKERIEIHGKQGSITLEGGNITVWKIQGCNEADFVEPEKISYGETNSPAISYVNHKAQLTDMLEAILYDREPAVNGEEGLKSLQIIKGIYASSVKRERVTFA